MRAQQVRQAGDGVEGVEVVHSAVQPVHAVLVARRAREQRGAAVRNMSIN